MTRTDPSLATLCARSALHAPIRGEPTAPPIPQTTAWAFRTVEDAEAAWTQHRGIELYARLGTPLHAAVEESLAKLEDMEAGCLFGTGMAALVCAVETLCPPGSTLLASRDLYGSTDNYFDAYLKERSVEVARIDCTDLPALDEALARKPALLVLEVLTNPTLKVIPLDAVSERARAAGVKILVDATFTPPPLMRVGALGADVIMHSASKSLAGHGDVSAGVILGPKVLVDKMRSRRSLMGMHLGAMEAFLLARGLRTLHLRVRQSCLNALFLAQRLEAKRQSGKLPRLARVIHPSLPGHPGGEWFSAHSKGQPGALLCIDLNGGADGAAAFVRNLEEIRLVPSLGDLVTSVAIPARSSHRGIAPDERVRRGITDGLVRISVGIEEAEDLAAELERAIAAS